MYRPMHKIKRLPVAGLIDLKARVLVKIEIALTDTEIGEKPRDCGMKTP